MQINLDGVRSTDPSNRRKKSELKIRKQNRTKRNKKKRNENKKKQKTKTRINKEERTRNRNVQARYNSNDFSAVVNVDFELVETPKCHAVSFVPSSQGLRYIPTIKVRLLMAAFPSARLSSCLSVFLPRSFLFFFHGVSFPINSFLSRSHFHFIYISIFQCVYCPFDSVDEFISWIFNVPLSLRMSNNDKYEGRIGK